MREQAVVWVGDRHRAGFGSWRGSGEDHPHGRNGARVPGVHGLQRAGIEQAEPLIDLVAVQADDELINALSGGLAVSALGLEGDGGDDHMVGHRVF